MMEKCEHVWWQGDLPSPCPHTATWWMTMPCEHLRATCSVHQEELMYYVAMHPGEVFYCYLCSEQGITTGGTPGWREK